MEKAASAFGVERAETAPARGASGEGGLFADAAEGAVVREKAARRFLAEAGARGCIDHQAGLVAVLGAGRARDDLHRLNRVGWNRRGENFIGLIGDGLAFQAVPAL